MSRGQPIPIRDLVELIFGYGLILGVIWMPESLQKIFAPIALIATAAIVLARCWNRDELGFGVRGLVPSLWILPAAAALALVGVLIAKEIGTLHPLYHPDASHISGYVLWTIYQQFLLQDYFMPRLLRLLPGTGAAVSVTAVLFAAAHMPNLTLAAATLVWGAVSCLLFRRYRNIWALGLAQGLLGLCFAVCVPNSLHHHLRVGLGYLRYHPRQAVRK
ncbi:MAG TPA: CPBP family intramembrane glutamic endopeptidase [Candidatus Aquilonibacter sp.]|nr:CPBP family intramembrane glutamic endopeptidase [Candidatus Aquilonibacter sp.]